MVPEYSKLLSCSDIVTDCPPAYPPGEDKKTLTKIVIASVLGMNCILLLITFWGLINFNETG